ncbi:MAG: hypothetical protein B7Y25_03065 [Alphaproteobacteria bacterium 16-39-46]|nr:MAG: hypothetical protein B7Y25_03065 [Alphaproteobacteria bacterium 16-39-46]OZA43394.1 MAG: hypothetical protein B7X84_03265 [Alphaproteobacteria bacterium 17-39-52]HQS83883.1 LuxR C-terminal-related transcriptional regulator [Alphaproteobacteria bacterium]HQS93728.1 LuxR C-terminal-related transcriptional regulator [Alphaproteobacteria bacterium]
MHDNIKSFINYNKSISVELNDIWSFLFKNSPISNVGVLRFYADGSVLDLNTDWKWIEHRMIKNLLYNVLFLHDLYKLKKNGIYMWPDFINNVHLSGSIIPANPVLEASYEYGYWGGCNLYQIESDYVEVYSFVGKKNECLQAKNFCINHLTELKSYIFYFNSYMNYVFKQDNISKILLKGENILFDLNYRDNNDFLDFFKNIKMKKYIIGDISFSQREYQCLKFLLKSYSAKQIATELNVSFRTIEIYIENIKIKTNCSYKNEIIDKYFYLNEII